MVTKICTKCHEEKDETDFYWRKDKRYKNGGTRMSKCKECIKKERREQYLSCDKSEHNRQTKEWADKNPERRREIQKRYYESHKEERLEYQREYRKNNPEKNKAHKAARKANPTQPDKCSNCGAEGRLERHHYDYEEPESIVWLCTRCHRKADNERRAEERRLHSTD